MVYYICSLKKSYYWLLLMNIPLVNLPPTSYIVCVIVQNNFVTLSYRRIMLVFHLHLWKFINKACFTNISRCYIVVVLHIYNDFFICFNVISVLEQQVEIEISVPFRMKSMNWVVKMTCYKENSRIRRGK